MQKAMLTSNHSFVSHKERSSMTSNPTAARLFSLMEEKKTNLSVAADVTRAEELLTLIHHVGGEICVLKTHIDILIDFHPSLILELRKLADHYRFLIFEDRKFADIGNTVLYQYRDGIYKISDWAEITNAHIVPGPGIIEGLKEVGKPLGRGLLLLAEMSSKGTLAQGDYTHAAVELAKQHDDFCIGFITTRKLTSDPKFIHFTPGVQFQEKKDSRGQQYQTPKEALLNQKTDIIIVGRGIIHAKDPAQEASRYRQEAWQAYLSSI